MLSSTARKAYLAAMGTMFKVGKVVNFTAGKVEQLVEVLVKEGEMKEPEARKFVRNSMDVLDRKAKEAQTALEKKVMGYQAAAFREINRLAKGVVKATNPPRKKPAPKK
jgi:polyhydroxyalkanoate synthesis regulator phasin